MPAETGKRFEYETAVEAGDPLSAHFHDYDWADEVLHAQIGRRWLKHEGISPEEAQERAGPIHEKTWAALDPYRGRARGRVVGATSCAPRSASRARSGPTNAVTCGSSRNEPPPTVRRFT